MAHRMAAEWTVSAKAFLSRAPKCRAVSTLTPPDMPMRNPVNSDTRMAVEPTAPRAMGPANRPTTAMSAILKRTCKRLERIRGKLNRKICFPKGPRVRSRNSCFMLFRMPLFGEIRQLAAHQCSTVQGLSQALFSPANRRLTKRNPAVGGAGTENLVS